jgi:hypothetical protein
VTIVVSKSDDNGVKERKIARKGGRREKKRGSERKEKERESK